MTAVLQFLNLPWIDDVDLRLYNRLMGFLSIGDLNAQAQCYKNGIRYCILEKLFCGQLPYIDWISDHCSVLETKYFLPHYQGIKNYRY